MDEDRVDLLIRLRMLRVVPEDEFDHLSLMGEVASRIGASPDELGAALLRVVRAAEAPGRES